ncbi:hypothetical protein HN51_021146 [Arachis hypogaea]|uniref:uncharacterized protein n=1 Tax=Arachis hypogaea TaxID=3818 RepID=UPI000DEC8414|nr:uncharacterized protein LOC112718004 [Arachis hypogaea]QHO52149.1 uncharacterized protein DS421_2g37060 [Arachis hypogaea]
MATSLRTFKERLQLLMPTDDGEWLKEIRGNLAMVATMIASMTFQIGLNPPGGVVQNSDNGFIGCPTPTGTNQACPGQSVFAKVNRSNYKGYLWTNSVSFYTSIISCIWLISGAPVGPGFPTLLLSTLMCVSLSLLAISYSFGVSIVNPPDDGICHYFFSVFLSFFAVLAVLFLYRFLTLHLATKTVRRQQRNHED